MPVRDALEERIRSEFTSWIRHHPNAALFDWAVATQNIAGAFAEVRREQLDRDTAHRIASERTRRALADVLTDICDHNYGLAERHITELMEFGVANDHGGPVTTYPFFEQALEELRRNR